MVLSKNTMVLSFWLCPEISFHGFWTSWKSTVGQRWSFWGILMITVVILLILSINLQLQCLKCSFLSWRSTVAVLYLIWTILNLPVFPRCFKKNMVEIWSFVTLIVSDSKTIVWNDLILVFQPYYWMGYTMAAQCFALLSQLTSLLSSQKCLWFWLYTIP